MKDCLATPKKQCWVAVRRYKHSSISLMTLKLTSSWVQLVWKSIYLLWQKMANLVTEMQTFVEYRPALTPYFKSVDNDDYISLKLLFPNVVLFILQHLKTHPKPITLFKYSSDRPWNYIVSPQNGIPAIQLRKLCPDNVTVMVCSSLTKTRPFSIALDKSIFQNCPIYP